MSGRIGRTVQIGRSIASRRPTEPPPSVTLTLTCVVLSGSTPRKVRYGASPAGSSWSMTERVMPPYM